MSDGAGQYNHGCGRSKARNHTCHGYEGQYHRKERVGPAAVAHGAVLVAQRNPPATSGWVKTENRVAAKSFPYDDMHSTTEQEAVATWPLRLTQIVLVVLQQPGRYRILFLVE